MRDYKDIRAEGIEYYYRQNTAYFLKNPKQYEAFFQTVSQIGDKKVLSRIQTQYNFLLKLRSIN